MQNKTVITNFWNNRVKKYGHTGWADDFIYAYDQQARILTIKQILSSLDYNSSLALDFGTGSGDFANLLAKNFKRVIAFDISNDIIDVAKNKYRQIRNIEFTCGTYINEIKLPKETVDLILSVTVLDHIIDDFELIAILNYFQEVLKKDGVLIAFEYALDYHREATSYQRFEKFEAWRSIFSKCVFYIYKYYGFYHPDELPCTSYLSYKRQITGVKGIILRSLIKYEIMHNWVNNYLNALANKNILENDDFFWTGLKKESPIKVMIFKKA